MAPPTAPVQTMEYLANEWAIQRTTTPSASKRPKVLDPDTPSTATSKFFSLPLEIREQIYSSVFNPWHPSEQGGVCSLKCSSRWIQRAEVNDLLGQMLLVSKQVSSEAKAVFIRECIKSPDFFRSKKMSVEQLCSLWRFCYGALGSEEIERKTGIKTLMEVEFCSFRGCSGAVDQTWYDRQEQAFGAILDRNRILELDAPGGGPMVWWSGAAAVGGRYREAIDENVVQRDRQKDPGASAAGWTVSNIVARDGRWMTTVRGPLLALE